MKSVWKWLGLSLYGVCGVLVLMFLLPFGGWKALDVLTGSMQPALSPGDLVIIHHVPLREIQVGDIVTYTNPANARQTITHRVVGRSIKDGVQMITAKGDANSGPDAPFPGGRIVGRVALTVPALGQAVGWIKHPLAVALIVVIPGLVVIASEVRTLRRRLNHLKPKTAPEITPPPPPPRPRPLVHLAILPALVLLAVGSTHARTTNVVTLTGNMLSATGPRCTPSSSTNVVSVTNSNNQTATTGSVSGAGSSGNATNTNSTSTTIVINNCSP
jgi:signal peptidase